MYTTREGGGGDIRAQLVSIAYGAENTAVPIPVWGGHRRGLMRKQEHKQGYGALGGGIPHLWGGGGIERGRKPRKGQPAMGW